jgi:hypothetical protein
MTDQWDEKIHCPQCFKTGMASLSQFLDAQIPTVDRVTDGFKAIPTAFGPTFHCGACDVAVDP